MIDWFRSWHGAPTDPKWLMIASRAKCDAGMVSAVVWALFDHASQQERRGDVSSFDPETYAAFSGWEADKIAAILQAMKDKCLIQDNRLSAWDKRQPKREDSSAERTKKWRERSVTQRDASERNVTLDKSREDKKEEDAADAAPTLTVVPDPPPSTPSGLERQLFARGKEVLGNNAGGMIKNLLKVKGRIELARSVIETAATKHDPREYVAGAIRSDSVDGKTYKIVNGRRVYTW